VEAPQERPVAATGVRDACPTNGEDGLRPTCADQVDRDTVVSPWDVLEGAMPGELAFGATGRGAAGPVLRILRKPRAGLANSRSVVEGHRRLDRDP
jgi:hypothetical protein